MLTKYSKTKFTNKDILLFNYKHRNNNVINNTYGNILLVKLF